MLQTPATYFDLQIIWAPLFAVTTCPPLNVVTYFLIVLSLWLLFELKMWVHIKPLNGFLSKANDAVRQVFHGKVTYASAPLETIDWTLFDFVCVDFFRETRIKDQYVELFRPYFAHNKPVMIGEFGCCTYQGAEDAGGWGWAIINPDANPPLLNGTYVRDEGLQARELTDQLGVLDDAGVDGAFVFTFVSPILMYNEDPHYDFDMASYSLVKSYDYAAWSEALKD